MSNTFEREFHMNVLKDIEQGYEEDHWNHAIKVTDLFISVCVKPSSKYHECSSYGLKHMVSSFGNIIYPDANNYLNEEMFVWRMICHNKNYEYKFVRTTGCMFKISISDYEEVAKAIHKII